MHDLVIRGGRIHDGTGKDAFSGDVAIEDDRIVAVGKVDGPARREIDADGLMVAPGWVDIHTHYDGQALWDPYLTPSSWHGCTTVVMGNCGVGFAPVRSGEENWLIELMESVEDIPGAALADGIEWGWEDFPGYLDALDGKQRAIDIGAQVPHCAVRAYVMGERCIEEETANENDIARMAAIVQEGLEAGALGFSTSRTIFHKTRAGEYVPGTWAGAPEMFGIADGMRRAGHGVLEMATDLTLKEGGGDLEWIRELSARYGVPVSLLLFQNDEAPRKYRQLLQGIAEANAKGGRIYAQVSGRTAGLLLCLDGSLHPFQGKPSYRALRDLPHEEKIARMKDPAVREAIITEESGGKGGEMSDFFLRGWHKMFRLGDPPNYEPDRSECFAERAKAEGRRPEDIAYDALLEFGGRGLIYFPLLNYSDYGFEAVREMLEAPYTHFSGSDGGAHCGVICDVSLPTFNMAYWGRDRKKGGLLPLEWLVHKQTQGTASLHGLNDRGVLAPGYLADINLIDFDSLGIDAPRMAWDLPTGARRLIQRASGYRMTIKSGQPILADGDPTGALPGALLRGPQGPRGSGPS
ncbi:N-acyl-D-amino-acid deacylase family protein [Minwuia thermotolerans]|uniref:Amidohydrolase n=1 Tax=Minwuia thermotolerans TaxID=2056226 RepID=A0A2M9G1T6_9PROT|nr:amidohydrolase family protein [Minwuia thermotolerans]PJK29624.1 amidohydrolase [Minwuia thermotolerans]